VQTDAQNYSEIIVLQQPRNNSRATLSVHEGTKRDFEKLQRSISEQKQMLDQRAYLGYFRQKKTPDFSGVFKINA
tara:strand:+ start:482 stop:706 length:225 start_codon:yes stop_codon:yes gene_type:complete